MSLKLIPDFTGFERLWGRYTVDNDGECYIPLSRNKRSRSFRILKETLERCDGFGYAMGGVDEMKERYDQAGFRWPAEPHAEGLEQVSGSVPAA